MSMEMMSARIDGSHSMSAPRTALGMTNHPVERDVSTSSDGQSQTSGSDSEDDEPLFNYSRLKNFPATFFRRDLVSAVLLRPAVCVIATHSGLVHFAELDMKPIRTVRLHRASVIDIDSDTTGRFVATASIDGTVVLSDVEDQQDVTPVSFHRPIYAVALSCSNRDPKSFLCGGTAGQVILSEPGWFKSRRDTVLYQGTSTIVSIRWLGNRAIWCNDEGVLIYDFKMSSIVKRIAVLTAVSSPEEFKPRMTVANDGSVFIGWAASFWVIKLDTATVSLTEHLDGIICGHAPVDNNQYVLLCKSTDGSLELRVLDENGEIIYTDEVEMSEKRSQHPNNFHLSGIYLPGETSGAEPLQKFLIVSSHDGVVAQRRTRIDHVHWLLSKKDYLAAFEAAKSCCGPAELQSIGTEAIRTLIENSCWKEAAAILAQNYPPDCESEWQHWASVFLDAGMYAEIGDVLPPISAKEFRTEILKWAMCNDDARLDLYVGQWPLDSYDTEAVCTELKAGEHTDAHLRALASIYSKMCEHRRAVKYLLEANSREAFDLVQDYHIWPDFSDRLPELIEAGLHPERDKNIMRDRIGVVVESILQLPPAKVVKSLEGHGRLLYEYLHQLRDVDETLVYPFSDRHLELCAQYAPNLLMSFLQHNNSYDLSKALEICSIHGRTEELVYLLGRVGQYRRALDLIVNELKDADQAVQFAMSHNDEGLWQYLVAFSADKPDFALELLRCKKVSPLDIIRIITPGAIIPGLREAILDVFAHQRTVRALADCVLTVVESEARERLKDLLHKRRRGILVNLGITDEAEVSASVTVDHTASCAVDWSKPVLIHGKALENTICYGNVSLYTNLSDKVKHLRMIIMKMVQTAS